MSTVPDTADGPEVFLQKKNRAEALRQSLPRLSLEHREVIDLAYYHGKSVKETLATTDEVIEQPCDSYLAAFGPALA